MEWETIRQLLCSYFSILKGFRYNINAPNIAIEKLGMPSENAISIWKIIPKLNNKFQYFLLINILAAKSNSKTIVPKLAWKLFPKGIKPTDALEQVEIMGNRALGEIALQMVSVMA